MNGIYQQLLTITEKYLSKDGQRFLDRQIKGHLNKPPEEIIPEDRVELAHWCMVSAALLVGTAKAQNFANEILNL